MIGGTYLCYEARREDLGEAQRTCRVRRRGGPPTGSGRQRGRDHRQRHRTDFILSAEIMVISLNEVADEPFLSRAAIRLVVADHCARVRRRRAIVKMDDVECTCRRTSGIGQAVGRGLVRGMPGLLTTLSVVGVAAMIWVGGHIALGLDDLGLHAPYSWVHHAEEAVHDAGPLGGVLAWLTNTIGLPSSASVSEPSSSLSCVIPSRRGTRTGSPAGTASTANPRRRPSTPEVTSPSSVWPDLWRSGPQPDDARAYSPRDHDPEPGDPGAARSAPRAGPNGHRPADVARVAAGPVWRPYCPLPPVQALRLWEWRPGTPLSLSGDASSLPRSRRSLKATGIRRTRAHRCPIRIEPVLVHDRGRHQRHDPSRLLRDSVAPPSARSSSSGSRWLH